MVWVVLGLPRMPRGCGVDGMGTRYLAFQHVAQRVLALDGTEAAGRGVIETTGWRIHTTCRRSRGGACGPVGARTA